MFYTLRPFFNVKKTFILCKSVKQIVDQRPERMLSCLVTRPDVPQVMFDMLKEHCHVDIWQNASIMPRDELMVRIKGKTALLCTLSDRIDSQVLDCTDNSLKVISTLSVGYDHIDIKECHKRGIVVGHTPDVLTDAVAELTIALLLATSRRLFEAEKSLRNGQWKPGWNHMYMCGNSIKGSVIGFVGAGRIGLDVLKRLKAFEPKQCLYCGNNAKSLVDSMGAKFVSFEELLEKSDFVIISCLLNDKTRHMFNEMAFKRMKKSAILINTSRGSVVDQKALYNALKNGDIKGAGLDVMEVEPIPMDDPLLSLSNAVILPHIGSASHETRVAMAELTARNVIAGLQQCPLPAAVPVSQ
ncbi:glyoxylate reductase/hydroxypyruvate reductase-like [Oppia nitens]|uniref:glyoxylate reductase/hydroxypyruvate reductase-like n=1 Tax=Oppia nitens TaxID=1686743 RepID=UPI0023D9D331|nr:glyoxylate reductase/hydroxypyruvate reductase-like [Oppia nitens]